VEPEISVVVPSYRRPDRLERMVRAMEAQTLDKSRFEVLIVDNQSGDTTSDVLAKLAANTTITLRPLCTPSRVGLAAAARNLGWQSARAPVIAYTDDDCVPDPTWLEVGLAAMESNPRVGVVQGVTRHPPGPREDWFVWREILEPTRWFEACNLFYRRDALDAAGGFDEGVGLGGEDTMAGWGVLDKGWERSFAPDALVWHDNEDWGLRGHLRYAWRVERRVCTIARRYPAFRQSLWRPWAIRPFNVAYCVGVIGVVLGVLWKRPLALLILPYIWMRRPPKEHPHRIRFAAERFALDTVSCVSLKIGAFQERVFLL
jgi:GT2 family glycosyltransferase